MELDDVLWAYRIALKTPLECSLWASLLKGMPPTFRATKQIILVIKKLNFNAKACGEKRLFELNELDEFRLIACENAKLSKERTNLWHDKRILTKDFEPRHEVLLYNSMLKLFLGSLCLGCLGLIL